MRRTMGLAAAALLGASCGASNAVGDSTLLVEGVKPVFLTVDDLSIAWSEAYGGHRQVQQVAKASGSAPAIVTLGVGYQPVIVDHVVYAMTPDQTLAGDRTGTSLNRYLPGGAQAVASFSGAGGYIAREGATVYLSTSNNEAAMGVDGGGWTSQIWAQPVDGSPAVLVAEDRAGQAMDIVASDGEIFWVSYRGRTPWDRPAGGGAIMKVSAQGGEAVEIARYATEASSAIAAGPGSVYWSLPTLDDDPCRSEALTRFDRLTGKTETFQPTGHIHSIALDAEHVYWTSDCGSEQQGTIRRMPITGGPDEVLARFQDIGSGTSYAVALDDDSVYWSKYAEPGAIYRLPKPPEGP